jgi:hypothetical protein
LAGLPVAVWLDLRNLTEAALRCQAGDLNSVITSIRAYYARNVAETSPNRFVSGFPFKNRAPHL